MEYLYAPWRGTYAKKDQCSAKAGSCPFCAQICAQEDQENLILKRLTYTTIFLNKFPYNPGHLLVIPNRHTANLDGLETVEHDELWRAMRAAQTIMTKTLQCTASNIGVNIGGKAAGGSIPDHLHVHIVPRWPGDTGFLPVVADTRPLSEDLLIIFNLLKEPFESLHV